MELNDKKILVVGLARTGVALCRFLAEQGRPGDRDRPGAACGPGRAAPGNRRLGGH